MRDEGMNLRLLLVEDDPVSQAFLSAATRALPADVDCAGSLHEALACAERHAYAAWLIDANLPDGSGADLLAMLRARQAPPWPPALAHTASQRAEDLQALRGAGFDAVVSKPLPVTAWQAAVRTLFGAAAALSPPCWDEAVALRALNGDAASVQTLRQLFVDGLPAQQRTVSNALQSGDASTALDELHRLKAGCGFVGAMQLRAACDALHASPHDADALRAFEQAVARTLGDVEAGTASAPAD